MSTMTSPRKTWPMKVEAKNDIFLSGLRKAFATGYDHGFIDGVQNPDRSWEDLLATMDIWSMDEREIPDEKKPRSKGARKTTPKKPELSNELAKAAFDPDNCKARFWNQKDAGDLSPDQPGHGMQCWRLPTVEGYCAKCHDKKTDPDSRTSTFHWFGDFDKSLIDSPGEKKDGTSLTTWLALKKDMPKKKKAKEVKKTKKGKKELVDEKHFDTNGEQVKKKKKKKTKKSKKDVPVFFADPVEEDLEIDDSNELVEDPVEKEETVVEKPVEKEETVVEEPIVKEETVVEKPIVKEETVVEEPIVKEETVVEKPIVKEETVVEKPIVKEETVVEEPIVKEETVVEEPVVEEPVVGTMELPGSGSDDELGEDTSPVMTKVDMNGFTLLWNKTTHELVDPDDGEVMAMMIANDEGGWVPEMGSYEDGIWVAEDSSDSGSEEEEEEEEEEEGEEKEEKEPTK
jgi:hypothetical protein